jgi:hypothetical protein
MYIWWLTSDGTERHGEEGDGWFHVSEINGYAYDVHKLFWRIKYDEIELLFPNIVDKKIFATKEECLNESVF